MKFDHVGLTTTKSKPGETLFAPNRVWITDASVHPYNVEWLRYEPDSQVIDVVKNNPHIGYIVDSIDVRAEGLTLLIEPFMVGDRRVAFFQTDDGVVLELIEELVKTK